MSKNNCIPPRSRGRRHLLLAGARHAEARRQRAAPPKKKKQGLARGAALTRQLAGGGTHFFLEGDTPFLLVFSREEMGCPPRRNGVSPSEGHLTFGENPYCCSIVVPGSYCCSVVTVQHFNTVQSLTLDNSRNYGFAPLKFERSTFLENQVWPQVSCDD